jgi:hypothetical protein
MKVDPHVVTSEAREKYLVDLAIARIQHMPQNVTVHIGEHGSFSQKELLDQIRSGSEIGREAVEIQIDYLRLMPKVARRMAEIQQP